MNRKTINSLCCLKCDKEISKVLANTFGRQVEVKRDQWPTYYHAEPLCRECYVELDEKYGGGNG